MTISRECLVTNCQKPVAHRGWCSAHYHRWLRYGDPLAGRTFEGTPLKYFQAFVVPYRGSDCLIWPFGKNPSGYGTIGHNGTRHLVSRLVCESINGLPPTPSHEAAHSCGNGHLGCCTPAHLSWKTRTANQADKVRHGTTNRGARSHTAKLSAAEVRKIRALSQSVTQHALAKQFKVSRGAISHIVYRTSWAWLD